MIWRPSFIRRDGLRAKLDLVRVIQSLERGAKGRGLQHVLPAHSRQTTAERMGKAVAAILDEAAEPMHVRDIRAAPSSRGVPLSGRGADANVIVHPSRMPDVFVRTGRGTYGLAKWTRRESNQPLSRSSKSAAIST